MTIENKFGFTVMTDMCKNANLVFMLDDIDGMQVDYINIDINLRDRKNPLVNRKTLATIKDGIFEGRATQLYSITQDNHAIQIKVGDQKATLRINNGKLEWIDKPTPDTVISDYTKARHDKLNAPFMRK